MSAKVTGLVSGVNQVRTAFRMLDTGLQARLRAAVAETTSEVQMGAIARVPVSGPGSRKAKSRPGPGELRDTIRAEFTPEGFTGYVKAGYGKLLRSSRAGRATSVGQARRQGTLRAKARARSLASRKVGAYAMVIEFGSPRQHKAAKPFMRPARQAAIPGHAARVARAVNSAVDAAGGSA